MRAVILAALALAVPASASETQFDLVCSFGKTPVRYRVDLAEGVACEGACERVWKVGAVTPGEIRLMDTLGEPDEIPQTITVNRQTGVLRHWIGGTRRPLTEEATCEAASFTGFPRSKF